MCPAARNCFLLYPFWKAYLAFASERIACILWLCFVPIHNHKKLKYFISKSVDSLIPSKIFQIPSVNDIIVKAKIICL